MSMGTSPPKLPGLKPTPGTKSPFSAPKMPSKPITPGSTPGKAPKINIPGLKPSAPKIAKASTGVSSVLSSKGGIAKKTLKNSGVTKTGVRAGGFLAGKRGKKI